ncbi:Dfp1/Him1, central region-domain-containing protein [Cladorrhinum sp. PSN259]|nr:Dfp1/Him1, central region-domain-containing protein [Cladorrhinum sp. PSN259]
MSTTRRVPLSNNPNVANSPMRASTAALNGAKKVRSHADLLREEPYGQPPPAKRQMIERSVASPTRIKTARTIVHRNTSRATAAPASRTAQAVHHYKDYKPSPSELDSISAWKSQMRERIPKMVFYFEGIPDELRTRLSKQVASLGARDEKFFSIKITHIVTARQIPPQKMASNEDGGADGHSATEQQLKTIDPSLLNRINEAPSVRRKLVFDSAPSRRVPIPVQDDPIKRPKPRNSDVLHRAREMGKKIWSVDKLQKIIEVMLEQDLYKSAVIGHSRGSANGTARASGQTNLRQALENERVHGPSDRDPTAPTIKDMYIFKGPYIYIYDMEEKTKPVMVREYPKVQDKKDGEWPQFRVASQGRCPFVEDFDTPVEKARTKSKEKASKAADETAAKTQQPPEVPPPKPATGKRSIAEMEDDQNRAAAESFDRSKISNPPQMEFRTQNAFMSHAKAGRLLGGEPVASGVNPSNVTSAIRSQMISSTSGVLGAKAGTSKEIHGLQRKVLQKASTPAVSQQDLSSRRLAEVDHDSVTFVRSASASAATYRKLDAVEEEGTANQREKLRRTVSVPVPRTVTKKRDPKPGYCENCLDKFDDFDEVGCLVLLLHILGIANPRISTFNLASTESLRIMTITGLSSTRSSRTSKGGPV